MPDEKIIDKSLVIANGDKASVAVVHQVDQSLLIDRIPAKKSWSQNNQKSLVITVATLIIGKIVREKTLNGNPVFE